MERKFIVFPLFMSGFVIRNPTEKQEILRLVKSMEEDSVGRNLVATTQLLESVYERQDKRRVEMLEEGRRRGDGDWGWMGDDVDWVGMIGELGLQVVNCRL